AGPNMDATPRDIIGRLENYSGLKLADAFAIPNLDREIKRHARYARQNGIHVSPTFMIDGLVQTDLSSGDKVSDWVARLAANESRAAARLRTGGEAAEFSRCGVEILSMIGSVRLECDEPAAEPSELIRRQLGDSFGDFLDLHETQYSTCLSCGKALAAHGFCQSRVVAKLKRGSVVSVENVETLVIGGGQAGLSMSEQLSKRGLPHLIVERHRIAERWRSERWDGLHANGPAWHDRLALMPIAGVDPDGFATPVQMVAYFVAFAERVAAPIRCGVAVTALHRGGGRGFCAQTPSGEIQATNVVVATGPFQRAAVPPIVPPDAGMMQIHSNA